MPRWAGGIIMLLFAANALWGIYDSWGNKNVFIGRYRVPPWTGKIFSVVTLVVLLVGAFLLFFGPWPEK